MSAPTVPCTSADLASVRRDLQVFIAFNFRPLYHCAEALHELLDLYEATAVENGQMVERGSRKR